MTSTLYPLRSIVLSIKIIQNEKSVLLKAQLIKRQVGWIRIDALDPVKDRLLWHQEDQVTVDRKAGIIVYGKTTFRKSSILTPTLWQAAQDDFALMLTVERIMLAI